MNPLSNCGSYGYIKDNIEISLSMKDENPTFIALINTRNIVGKKTDIYRESKKVEKLSPIQPSKP